MASKKTLNERIRSRYMKAVADFFSGKGEEILVTGSNEICLPCLNDEGDDEFIVITFKYSRFAELLVCQLAMGVGCRMKDACVAVGDMCFYCHKPESIHEPVVNLPASLECKSQYPA